MQSALKRRRATVALLLTARTAVLCQRGQAADAIATVEKLSEVAPQDGESQFSLAAACRCAPRRRPRGPGQAARPAMAALRRAADLGFKDLVQITNRPGPGLAAQAPGLRRAGEEVEAGGIAVSQAVASAPLSPLYSGGEGSGVRGPSPGRQNPHPDPSP